LMIQHSKASGYICWLDSRMSNDISNWQFNTCKWARYGSCFSKTFRFSFYVLDSQKSITDCEIRILKSLCHCPLIVWITLHFKHVSLQVSSFDLLNWKLLE
jgi:hypothetical protein